MRHILKAHGFLFGLMAFLSTLPALTLAQTDKVYHIELIVFERFATEHSDDPEVPPKHIDLAYPASWRRLVDPAEEAARLERLEQEAKEASRWQLSNELLQSLGSADSAPAAAESASTPAEATPPQASALAPDAPAAPAAAFFEYQPESEHQLRAEARALNRAPELRVLYHRVWHQPLSPPTKAKALLLRGGNQFGNHYELEGAITLHVSRYIHLQTQLWLTQFVPNHGQADEFWPTLPPFPTELDSLYHRLTSDLDVAPAWLAGDLTDAGARTTAQAPGNIYTSALAQSAETLTPTHAAPDSGAEAKPYLVNQIVTLRQARRMRSNEVHYLDHPRMGLLIRVTPLADSAKEPAQGND